VEASSVGIGCRKFEETRWWCLQYGKKSFLNTLYLKYNMAEEVVKPQEEEEEEKKAEVSLTELIRELIQGKKEQKAKLIDVA
jgi:hypothetical protein